MLVTALVTGVEHIKGAGKGDAPKPFDFHKVNFIDTENPAGSPQSMTLPKDNVADLISQFDAMRMKICKFNVFQNGTYTNFGSFVKA